MLTVRDNQMQQMADSNPGQPMVKPCDQTKTWIEFRLVDSDNQPVAGEKYKVRLPDSSLREGTLDSEGKVRFDNIIPGQASICFPDQDEKSWNPL